MRTEPKEKKKRKMFVLFRFVFVSFGDSLNADMKNYCANVD